MPPATVTPLLIKNGIGAGPLEGPDHWIKPMVPPAAIQHGLSTSRFLTQHRPISSTVNERMPSQMSARGEEVQF